MVSVCIITFNHRPWIRQAVESVLAQRHHFELEVLVADDCSTDGTSEILRDLCLEHPNELRIVVNKQNMGAGRNFWNLLHVARGDFLAFLEGDDYWVDDERLNKQLSLFDQYPEIELVVANTRIIKQSDISDVPEEIGEFVHLKFNRPGINEVMRQQYHVSSYLMRREVLPRFDAWYGKYGNVLDIYHLCEAVARTPAAYLDEVVSVRRVTGQGVYSKFSSAKKLAFDFLWSERLFKHFKGTADSAFYNRVYLKAVLLSEVQDGVSPLFRNLAHAFGISRIHFFPALFRNFKLLGRVVYGKFFKRG